MLDLFSRDWRPALLDMAGLRADLLSPVKETGTPLGAVTETAARQCGLRAGTPVIMGGGDVQLGCLGLGWYAPAKARCWGHLLATGGESAGGPYRSADEYSYQPARHSRHGAGRIDQLLHRPDHALVPRCFCAEEKLVAERLGVDAYALLEEMASRVPPGSHGVMPIFSDAMHFKQWYHAAPSFINLSIDPEKCNKATLFRALEENAAIVSACNRRKSPASPA